MIESITEKKGWTLSYVLEHISWSNLIMMSSDRVRMVKRSDIVKKVSKDELKTHRQKYNG